MRSKAQAILLVLFLLALAGTLIVGLSGMLRAEVRMRALEQNGVYAFYLAQAGIERAKIELVNNWENWGGLLAEPLGAGTYDISISVSSLVPDGKCIVSSGRVRDSWRQITVTIERTGTAPGPYEYNQVSNSWLEI